MQRWNDALTSCLKAMLTSNKETAMKVTALTALALLLASSAHAAEKPSQSFLKKAIQGNYAEVEMGKLAQQNARATM
jgi:predicted outer membrane protein